jgi:hypothetical protein
VEGRSVSLYMTGLQSLSGLKIDWRLENDSVPFLYAEHGSSHFIAKIGTLICGRTQALTGGPISSDLCVMFLR